MVKVEEKDDISNAVSEFLEVFQEPVSHCARFYVNYYLSVEENVGEYDYWLSTVSSMQAEAFWNYAIYSCSKELSNIFNNFRAGNMKLKSIVNGKRRKEMGADTNLATSGGESIHEAAEVYVDLLQRIENEADPKYRNLVKNIMLKYEDYTGLFDSRRNITFFCEKMEEKFNAFTEPEIFLSACKFIFGHNFSEMYKNGVPDFLNTTYHQKLVGWTPAYGGEGWERVSKTALKKREFGDETFVDLMWSVEHNNGNFINKVPDIEKEEKKRIKEMLRKEWENLGGKSYTRSKPQTTHLHNNDVQHTVLPVTLDFAKDGNIEPLYNLVGSLFNELRNRQIRHIDFPHERDYMEDERILELV